MSVTLSLWIGLEISVAKTLYHFIFLSYDGTTIEIAEPLNSGTCRLYAQLVEGHRSLKSLGIWLQGMLDQIRSSKEECRSIVSGLVGGAGV